MTGWPWRNDMAHHKGAHLHQERIGYGLFSGLVYRMAAKMSAETQKPASEPKRKGKTRIPDDVVLAIRKAAELEGLTCRQVCDRFPEMRPDTVRQIINYQIRANITLTRQQTKGGV